MTELRRWQLFIVLWLCINAAFGLFYAHGRTPGLPKTLPPHGCGE